MMIKRGDVTDIVWFARLEMNCLITYQRKTVDNMPPWVNSYLFWQATNQIWASVDKDSYSLGGTIILVTLAFLDVSSKKRCL